MPTPEKVAPAVDTVAPPESGHGRLVVDVVDGPTPVRRVRMESKQTDDGRGRVAYRFFESAELLCATSPCVADLPTGNVLLRFPVLGDERASEIELVHVGPRATVYRRSLSQYDGRTGSTRVLGIVATAVGASAAITGTALLPIGLSKGNDDLTLSGGITLAAGAALLALGIWAITSDSPTYRPGSSVHFPLSSPNPARDR